MEDKIIELQKQVTHNEHSIEELKEIINDQHQTILGLQAEISGLKNKLTDESLVRPIDQEEPPPHY